MTAPRRKIVGGIRASVPGCPPRPSAWIVVHGDAAAAHREAVHRAEVERTPCYVVRFRVKQEGAWIVRWSVLDPFAWDCCGRGSALGRLVETVYPTSKRSDA